MPKPAKGARLGGSPAHERLILANLCKDIITNKSVVTTETRAKRVRPHIEKLITKAKRGNTHNRREALKVLGGASAGRYDRDSGTRYLCQGLWRSQN